MPLSNPRDSYKALLLDYDALIAAGDKECSFCLSEREVQIILAFVEYIGWKTRYITTETPIDGETILRWQGNLARKLMSGCCCDDDGQQERMTPDGVIEISNDGGATWHPATTSEDPRTSGSYQPAVDTSTDEGKCSAANSAVAYFKQIQAETYEKMTESAGLAALAALLIGFLAVVGVIASGGALAVFFAGIGAVLTSLDATAWNALFDDDLWADLLCDIYCKMDTEGFIAQDDVLGVAANIRADHPDRAGQFVSDMLKGMGQVGLTNAIRLGLDGALSCDDCDCCDDQDETIIMNSAVNVHYFTSFATDVTKTYRITLSHTYQWNIEDAPGLLADPFYLENPAGVWARQLSEVLFFSTAFSPYPAYSGTHSYIFELGGNGLPWDFYLSDPDKTDNVGDLHIRVQCIT